MKVCEPFHRVTSPPNVNPRNTSQASESLCAGTTFLYVSLAGVQRQHPTQACEKASLILYTLYRSYRTQLFQPSLAGEEVPNRRPMLLKFGTGFYCCHEYEEGSLRLACGSEMRTSVDVLTKRSNVLRRLNDNSDSCPHNFCTAPDLVLPQALFWPAVTTLRLNLYSKQPV